MNSPRNTDPLALVSAHLGIALCASVPLHIQRLKDRGGPSQADLTDCEKIAMLVGEFVPAYLSRSLPSEGVPGGKTDIWA